MSGWGAQQVQLVWFLTDVANLHAAELFSQTWDGPPDQTQANRIPTPEAPFLSQAGSRRDGMAMQVVVQPGRVDLFVSVDPEQEPQKMLGSLFDLTGALAQVVAKLKVRPLVDRDAFRLAAVATFLKPVDTYSDAVKEWTKFSGMKIQAPSPSDLVFQINSRAALSGILCNRLINLSVFAIQPFAISLPPTSGSVASAPALLSARRHVDCNTVPDGRLLESDRHHIILSSLMSEIVRIHSSNSIKSLEE